MNNEDICNRLDQLTGFIIIVLLREYTGWWAVFGALVGLYFLSRPVPKAIKTLYDWVKNDAS